MSVFKSLSDLHSPVMESLSDGIMLILLLFEEKAVSPRRCRWLRVSSDCVLGKCVAAGWLCIVVVRHRGTAGFAFRGWEERGGGWRVAEFEEIKALFALRGKGEWVQPRLLLSYKLSCL